MSQGEFEDIHLGTLEVLAQTGIYTDDPEALTIFEDGGCAVDRGRGNVRIPAHVVEAAIESAPPRFLAAGRAEKDDIVFDAGRVGFTTFGEGIKVVDPETGELRESTKHDIGLSARLADALDEIDTYEVAVGAKDAPPSTAPLHNYEASLCNTTKHVCAGPLSSWQTKAVLRMAAAVVGGMEKLRERPILTIGVCPVSPLQLPRDCSEPIIEGARAGVPSNILSMAMSGASAPVTLGGTLITHNAEVLAGITLAQLAAKGSPVFYGSSTTAMDLRYASASVGSPECAMISAAVAFIARQYRLPSYVAGA
jgi:trimethylamine--corrinoid protein Co-methyltransferase